MLVTFGSYDLLARIAVGGMAEVFVARSPDRGLVVLKRMHAELALKPRGIELFLDEGQLGTLLKHPCIVETLDIGKEGDAWYLTLEHIDGPDFGDVSKTARESDDPSALPSPRICAYVVARAAEGLHYAHQAVDPKTGEPLRLVHRDVSPSNILIGRHGAVKISDFGVAKHSTQLHTTAAGRVIGKLAYMSPEQVLAETLDARTDVYALAICLWEALANRRLYGELPPPLIMHQIVEGTPPGLGDLDLDPPPPNPVDLALGRIITKALKKKRQERYEDAEQLQHALDAWLGGPDGVAAARAELSAFISERYPAHASLVERALVSPVPDATTPSSPPPSASQPSPSSPSSQSSSGSPASSSRVGGDRLETTELEVTTRPEGDARKQRRERPPAAAVAADAPTQERDPSRPVEVREPPRLEAAPRDVVLYVEDEDDNWLVVSLRLKKTYELIRAASDKQACEILRARGREIGAVLMDIQLKGSALDGISLVKLIRGSAPVHDLPEYARGVPTLSMPIFFVTAYSARYTEAELLAAGADKLVTKPVDFPALTLALTSHRLRRAAAVTTATER